MGIFLRWSRGYEKVFSTPDWDTHFPPEWKNTIMSVSVTDRLHEKQGRSIARWTITPDFVVYLKRHYKLPFRDGLRAVLFPKRAASPGLQEWEHLAIATKLGIPIPKAVSVGEWLQPKGKLSSFIAVQELTNQLPLHEAIPLASQKLSPVEFRRWKNGLIKELVRLSHLFHSHNYFHRDWYLCHFYIHENDIGSVPNDWTNRVTVIDLHRMTHQRFKSFMYRAKDLAQLLYSSTPIGVTPRDRLQFWAVYRRSLSKSSLVKWLALRKWKLYQRHDRPNG